MPGHQNVKLFPQPMFQDDSGPTELQAPYPIGLLIFLNQQQSYTGSACFLQKPADVSCNAAHALVYAHARHLKLLRQKEPH